MDPKQLLALCGMAATVLLWKREADKRAQAEWALILEKYSRSTAR